MFIFQLWLTKYVLAVASYVEVLKTQNHAFLFTGKSKYALEEEADKAEKPDWGKDGLHKHEDKKDDEEEAEEGGEEEVR